MAIIRCRTRDACEHGETELASVRCMICCLLTCAPREVGGEGAAALDADEASDDGNNTRINPRGRSGPFDKTIDGTACWSLCMICIIPMGSVGVSDCDCPREARNSTTPLRTSSCPGCTRRRADGEDLTCVWAERGRRGNASLFTSRFRELQRNYELKAPQRLLGPIRDG